MSYDYNVNQVNTNYGGDGSWQNPMPPIPESRSITVPLLADACTPDAVQDFLDRATTVSMRTVADFVDRRGRRVAIPLGSEGKHPVLCEGYAKAWWELKCRDLLLGDDGETVFRRGFDKKTHRLLDVVHKVANLETEFHVPTQKTVDGMSDLVVAVLETLDDRPRVHRGIKFDGMAFAREELEDGTTAVRRIDATDPRLNEPWEIQFDAKFDERLAAEAMAWLEWMTNEGHSRDNLARMFANPVLEPEKLLTYIGYGQGGNGKGTCWEMLEKDPVVGSLTTSFDTVNMFPQGAMSTIQEQAPLSLQGKLWACDTDSDPLVPRQMKMFKKLASGDPVQARQIGQSTVTIRNSATLVIFTNCSVAMPDTQALGRRVVNIRFRDGRASSEFRPLRAFIAQHGVVPFMMASCLLWETGDKPWTDVCINDADSLTDYEAAIVDAIVERGYVVATTLPKVTDSVAEAVRDRLGLKLARKRVADPETGENRQLRCLVVANESRFAPFRSRVLGEIARANEIADSVDETVVKAVRDMFAEHASMKLGDEVSGDSLRYFLSLRGLVNGGEDAVGNLVAAGVIAADGEKFKLIG